MVKIKNYKFAKSGPEHLVIIPRNYIKNGLLDPEKRYNIEFSEVEAVDGN